MPTIAKPYGYKLVKNVIQRTAFDLAYGESTPRSTLITKQVFIGNPKSVRRKLLKGKTALVCPADTGFVLAQFDDRATGLGYGWHRFRECYFKPI